MQREHAVSTVYEAIGLQKEEQRGAEGDADEEEEGEQDKGGPQKKRQRRASGSSSGSGAQERGMSMFAEVMSKFYPQAPQQQAAASSSAPITPEQWLADCMVSDEQRGQLVKLLPDPRKPFTLLILSSFDDETLSSCDFKPFQTTAWKKLAAKYA